MASTGDTRRTPTTDELPAPAGVVIEHVAPEIDGGRFPIKRVVGDRLVVEADIFTHGHDALLARLLHRRRGATSWSESPMTPLPNDRWRGSCVLGENGSYEYTIFAWRDPFRSWCTDLRKRLEGGQHQLESELREGRALLEQASLRADGDEHARRYLRDVIDMLDEHLAGRNPVDRASELLDGLERDGSVGLRAELVEIRRLLARAARQGGTVDRTVSVLDTLLGDELAAVLERHADRGDCGRYDRVLEVLVERDAARFGAWYEMFPRSQGVDPQRSATFADMERRLPEIAQLGFDVVYLPPIHPIGRTNRKGPNNSLECPPGSPGCPYAIGDETGGHTAVHPDLGTIDDFDHFVAACRSQGLEVALDYALQASPDHPWVEEHPEWFLHRPDGTIKFAENPPKKYEDIYPLNFATSDREGLWRACLEILRFWIGHGVRIFRVDNPHTKPVQFWRWLLAQVRRDHPDVVFLSEAFTRPKMMKALAKVGFTQSYTYFTWRNFKHELTEYFVELTQTDVAETMRGNLFTNTPDILPAILQNAPRQAFMMRATLAATLSSLWGIYNGFELCEGTPVPGREEYLDSEKYQHKVWDWNRPGNIKDYISRLNRIRHEQPALRHYRNLRFCDTEDDNILCYYKSVGEASDVVLVVVNLDPFQAHETLVHVPLAALDLSPDENFQMHDLLDGERYIWHGSANYVRLDPTRRVAHVFRLLRWSHREQEFDYYI